MSGNINERRVVANVYEHFKVTCLRFNVFYSISNLFTYIYARTMYLE